MVDVSCSQFCDQGTPCSWSQPVDERVRRKGTVGSLPAASPDTPAAEPRGADVSLANAVQTLWEEITTERVHHRRFLLVACLFQLGIYGDFILFIRNQLGNMECDTQCHLPSAASAPSCAQPSPSLAALSVASLMSCTSQHQPRGKKRPFIAD